MNLFAAILFFLFATNVVIADDKIKTPILKKEIDFGEVLAFSKLPEDKMVESLRKDFKVKVVFTGDRKDPQANVVLKDVPQDDHKDTPKYFETKKLDGPFQFVKPFHRLESKVKSAVEFPDRPHITDPVLMISPRISRLDLLSGFMSYQIWKNSGEKSVRVDKVSMTAFNRDLLEADRISRRLESQIKEIKEETDAKKQLQLYIEITRNKLLYTEKLLKVSSEAWGEELDVRSFLIDQANDLKLSAAEKEANVTAAQKLVEGCAFLTDSLIESVSDETVVKTVEADEDIAALHKGVLKNLKEQAKFLAKQKEKWQGENRK